MKVLKRSWQAIKYSFNFIAQKVASVTRVAMRQLAKRKRSQAVPPPVPSEPRRSSTPPVVRQYEEHPSAHYMKLKYRFRDIGRMKGIAETLGRDFLTAMPEGAWKSRLGQIAFLHRRIHDDLVDSELAHLVEGAKNHAENHSEDWDEWDRANLREMEKMHADHLPISSELIEKRARLSYEGRRIHRDSLAASDWPRAREFLSNLVDLNKQVAEAKAKKQGANSLYQVLVNEHMPGVTTTEIEDWFGDIEKRLDKLLPKILQRQDKEEPPIEISDFYPAKAQMWLNQAMLSAIGFDFQRGGLYETGHNPVEGGTPDDTRLVIKNVDIHNFLDSMKSAMHEGGHGIYIQGLPRKIWRYQPVAQDMGALVHESQALIIEMIMGRTRAFFSFLSPRVEGLFHGLNNPVLSAANIHKSKTWVQPSPVRKKADEVTYFYHILHRYRMEKDLIEGNLKVNDVPEAWNASIQNLLDVQPKNLAEGCLQDVHWFVGKFGYFPSYALGHMMAAQLYESIRKDIPDTDSHIAAGDFMQMTGWLRERIHRKGRLLEFHDLVKESTGKPLNADAMIHHLESRYLGKARETVPQVMN